MNRMLKVMLVIAFFAAGAGVFAQNGTISISTSYNNLLSNPEGTGMLDRTTAEAFRRIGYEAELVYTQTEKALHDVDAGILDAEINRIGGMEKEYPNLVRVPEPNMTMRFVAFSSSPLEITDWQSLEDYDIGIVRGWKILEAHTAGFPSVTFVPTEVELFTMLEKGRIDAALYAELTGYAALRDLDYSGIRHIEPPLAERDMYLYLHRSLKELALPLAEALRDMKRDGTYDRIAEETLDQYLPSVTR